MTEVRTSHAFGADLSDGAGTEFCSEEWQTILRAAADHWEVVAADARNRDHPSSNP